jgi:hypothetical protein
MDKIIFGNGERSRFSMIEGLWLLRVTTLEMTTIHQYYLVSLLPSH